MEFVIAVIAGIVFVKVLQGLKRDESKIQAGSDARVCPFCAEHIKAAARVCRYCGRDVPPPATVEAPLHPQLRPWREVFGLHQPALLASWALLSLIGLGTLILLIGG